MATSQSRSVKAACSLLNATQDGSNLQSMQTPHRLNCAETWAGNDGTSNVALLPGLRVSVHSRPFGPGDAGGDVHYVSVCPSCIVSRIALADVSGHGRAVVSLGAKLRQLMQNTSRPSSRSIS